MGSRKSFLRVVSMTGTSLAVASPSVVPGPTPAPAKITAAAHAQAEAMRRFDPHLTDAQIATIGRGIDDAAKSARQASAHEPPLRNGDEPVTRLRIADGPA